MLDAKTGQPRQLHTSLSLRSLIHSLGLNIDYPLHNSGNDAFVSLLAFQLLVDPQNTKIPPPKPRQGRPSGYSRSISMFSPTPMVSTTLVPPVMPAAMASRPHSTSPHLQSLPSQSQLHVVSSRHSQFLSSNASGNRRGTPAVDENGRLVRPLSSGDLLAQEMARTTIE